MQLDVQGVVSSKVQVEQSGFAWLLAGSAVLCKWRMWLIQALVWLVSAVGGHRLAFGIYLLVYARGHSPAQDYGIDSWDSDVVADVALGLVAHTSQGAADLDEFILLRLVCVVSLLDMHLFWFREVLLVF